MPDPASRPRIELLAAAHDPAASSAARMPSTAYFQRQITQDARRHLATPFVMIMPDSMIGGFYTLSSTALRLAELPEDITKRLPRYPLIPAALIGRLALDRRCHGQGWGSFLLLDARCIAAPSAISLPLRLSSTRSTTKHAASICTPAFCRCRIRHTACSGGWPISRLCSDNPITCPSPWRSPRGPARAR